MRQTPERLAILLLLWWAQPASMQAPAVLLVATNPDSAVARQTFLTQPVVELRDTNSDQPFISGEYKIRASNSIPDRVLLGTTFILPVNGTARFTDLRYENPGSGYIIKFEMYTMDNILVDGTDVQSVSFTVQPPFVGLRAGSKPAGSMVAGHPLNPLPSVQLLDADQKVLFYGDNVVFVTAEEISTQPRPFPALRLSGRVSEFSCCRAPNCQQLQRDRMQAVCDCEHPDAALCAVPVNGIVTFHNITVNKAGTHLLSYRHVEIMPRASPNDPVVEEEYTLRDDGPGFEIVSGPAEALAMPINPGPVSIGNVTGNEPAVLDPQPSCAYSDSQGNTISIGSTGTVVAMPCVDLTDPKPMRVDSSSYCRCDDEECLLAPTKISETRVKFFSILKGNVQAMFDEIGVAKFTDLKTDLARSDIRITCRYGAEDSTLAGSQEAQLDPSFKYVLTPIYVHSDPFTVYPGRLQSLVSIFGPGTTLSPGCARCPEGIHFPEEPLAAAVQLLDSADNELDQCSSTSRFCAAAPSALLYVTLIEAGQDVSSIPVDNLHGTTETYAVDGKAHFENIKITRSNLEYRLRFLAQATNFLSSGLSSKYTISVESDPFIVVNGPPAKITLVTSPGTATDAEVLTVQPAVGVLDLGDNQLRSDCYDECGGLLNGTCSATVANDMPECAPVIEAELVGARPPSKFLGTMTSVAKSGVAIFTDLLIDSGASEVSDCMCSPLGGCTLCHCNKDGLCEDGVCNPPPPFPNYNIRMSLAGASDVYLDVPVFLQRRVSMIIMEGQPGLAVAREPFKSDIIVKVMNCAGELVSSAAAIINVAIEDNGGARQPGVLSGTFPKALVGGFARFTDLSIQAYGPDYTLSISFEGRTVVPNVITASFEVVRGVESLQMLTSPTDTTNKAGRAFTLQPQIILKDVDDQVVTRSNARVTAAIAENPGAKQSWDPANSILTGERIIEAVDGRIRFTNLALEKASVGQGLAQTGYTLVFLFNNMRATTGVFFVEADLWTGLFITPISQPNNATAGEPFPNQIRVLLVDRFKNKLLPTSVPTGAMVDVRVEDPAFEESASRNPRPIVLQRHGCMETCVGVQPLVCTTCPDKRLSAQSGEVTFTDLRIDFAGRGFRLTFTCETFAVTSEPFDVENAAPSYLFISTQPSRFNRADLELIRQPVVSMHDAFGNLLLQDSIPFHTIDIELSTRGGLLPSPAGFPDVPGQEPNTICRVSDQPLAGTRILNATRGIATFTDLAVRPTMSGFTLIFRGMSSRGLLNVTSEEFQVDPGLAVGLCNMSLPGRCSSFSPCLDAGILACVDSYGNVQPTCGARLGSSEDNRPYGVGVLPVGMAIPCFGKVCVSIIQPATAILRQGPGGEVGINCAEQPCGAEIDINSGFATFTDLVLDIPSRSYIFKFTAYLVHPESRMIYEWTYISPPSSNLPPAPIVSQAVFSSSFASISLKFNRPTNMNKRDGRSSSACEAMLDANFLQTLGAGPRCAWTGSQSYQIVPGSGAYANQSTEVLLSNESYVIFSRMFSGVRIDSLPASTDTNLIVEGNPIASVRLSVPSVLPSPVPIVLGAQHMSACDLLEADASLSYGAAARPFAATKWSVDFSESYLYKGILTSAGTKLEFFKRRIHFSSLLPNAINTVTITIRPSAPVESNSTLHISGIPGYHTSMSGCPAQSEELAQPCLSPTDRCMEVELQGPSGYLFSSHLAEDPLEANKIPISWWQVGASQLFKRLDQDHSGSINLVEFQLNLRETVDYVGDARTRERFEAADKNVDGTVSKAEFLSTRPLAGTDFISLDLDHSGFLNKSEVRAGVIRIGDFLSEVQLEQKFQSLDPDVDGRISESEYRLAPMATMNSRHLQNHPSAFQSLDAAGGIQLHVNPSHYIPSFSDTIVSFKIQNPPLPYMAQPIMIKASCDACKCQDEQCTRKAPQAFDEQRMKMYCSENICQSDAEFRLENPPLTISGSISESNKINGAHNLLQLDFHISDELPAGGGVVVKGLPDTGKLPQKATASTDLCLEGPSAQYFVCKSCDTSGYAFGTWQADGGEFTLVVNNGSSLPAGRHQLAWHFYNPVSMQRSACKTRSNGTVADTSCPSLLKLTLHASYQFEHARLQSTEEGVELDGGAQGVLGAGYAPTWKRAYVSESNRFAGVISHLLIEIEADVGFAQMTEFTVSGFPSRSGWFWGRRHTQKVKILAGMDSEDGGADACVDPADAEWDASGTSFSWKIKHISRNRLCSVPADTRFRFAIAIVNANTTSVLDDSALTIRARHAGCAACVSDACGCQSAPLTPVHPWTLPERRLQTPQNTAPDGTITSERLLSANRKLGIIAAEIADSNPVAGETATITVSFRPSFTVMAGSNITISGLRPSATPTSPALPVRDSRGLESSGRFEAAEGTLQLALRKGLVANEDMSFSFILRHSSLSAVDHPMMRGVFITPVCVEEENLDCAWLAETGGLPPMETVELTSNLNGSILHVHTGRRQLLDLGISESTNVKGSLNILTVHLQANFEMRPGFTVVVTGLAGTKMDKTPVLGFTPVPSRTWLLPNCSCTRFEAMECDCSSGARKSEKSQFRVWQPQFFFGEPTLVRNRPSGEAIQGSYEQDRFGEGNSIRMAVAAGKVIPAELKWQFSFVLRSAPPRDLQPMLSVLDADGVPIVEDQKLNGTVFENTAEPDFDGVWIEEDSDVFSAQNNITLSVALNSPLVSTDEEGATITVSGMRGFQTPSGYLQLHGEHAYFFGKRGVVEWSRERETLVFQGVSLPGNCFPPSDECWLPGKWRVTFQLSSRKEVSAGQALPSIQALSGIEGENLGGFGLRLIGGSPLNRASKRPIVSFASLMQDSKIQGARNNLTLSFAVSTTLPGQKEVSYSSLVSVTGLVGTLTPDHDALPVYGDDAGLFAGRSARWRRSEGSLTLAVAADVSIVADYNVQISVIFINPLQAQQPVSPKISAVVRYPPPPPARFHPDVGTVAFAPVATLQLPAAPVAGRGILSSTTRSRFTTKIVHESTQVSMAANHLTITLAANIDLPAGVVIQVEGFDTTSKHKTEVMPLLGPSAALFGGTAVFKIDLRTKLVRLQLVLRSMVAANDQLVVFFVFQNQMCSGTCPGLPVRVSAEGGANAPNIQISAELMDSPAGGAILGGGGEVSWVSKHLYESTDVLQESNTIIIELQVNAPLYEGSQIVISGLVSRVLSTCLNCFSGPWAMGSGCSSSCTQCADASSCVPVLMDEYSAPHDIFQNSLGQWDANDNLVLTVREGTKIVATRPVKIVLKMRNALFPENRKECWSGGDSVKCLRVSLKSGKLCTESRPFPAEWHSSEDCSYGSIKATGFRASISDRSPTIDHFQRPLLDSCATCLRPSDLHVLDVVLQQQTSLVLTDIAVSAPSMRGLPSYILGGLVPGNYTIRLDLRNWLHQQSRALHRFSKDLGQFGQTHTEDLKPTIYIQGFGALADTQVSIDRDLVFHALAKAASCLPNAPRQVLSYEWKMTCVKGPCTLVPPLQQLVLSTNTRSLHLRPFSLVPSVSYVVEVMTNQDGLQSQLDAVIQKSQSSISVVAPVRPIMIEIVGVSDGGIIRAAGQEVKLELNIQDPEVRTSGFTTGAHFNARWGCMIQLEQQPCPETAASCPPPGYIPCNSSTLQVAARPCTVVDPRCDHYAVLYPMGGKNYQIDVNASRNVYKFRELGRAAIFDWMDPDAVFPSEWATNVRKTVPFRVEEGEQVATSIIVCSPTGLGTKNLCNLPQSTVVNANDKLVLRATARSIPPALEVKNLVWAFESGSSDAGGNLLSEDNVSANLKYSFGGLLVVDAGVLTPGGTLLMRLTVRNVLEHVGTASLSIHVRMPPSGGNMVVSPSEGIGMQTEFRLEAIGWGTDIENYPMTYSFFCNDEGSEAELRLPVWSSVAFAVDSLLPTSRSSSHTLVVNVLIEDVHFASSEASTNVTVRSPGSRSVRLLSLLDALLLNKVDSLFRVGDMANVQGQVGIIAHALNSDLPCAAIGGKVQQDCLTGDQVSRQVFRARLLLTVQAANNSLLPTAKAVAEQTAILLRILDRPAEINYETADLAANLLDLNVKAIWRVIGTSRINVGQLSYLHGIANTRLLETLEENSKLLGSVRPPRHPVTIGSKLRSNSLDSVPNAPEAEEAQHAIFTHLRVARETIRQGQQYSISSIQELSQAISKQGFPHESARQTQGSTGTISNQKWTTRQQLTTPGLRELEYWLLIHHFAAISSLSLAQVEAGGDPVVLHVPGFTVNSSHVPQETILNVGWTFEGNGSRIQGFIPPTLLSEELSEGEMPASFEIMHIFVHPTFEATLNLPASFSGLLILQVRRKGSSQTLPLVEPLAAGPWQLFLPLTAPVPKDPDDFLGTENIPFGSWFDYDSTRGDREANWFWSTRHMVLQTRPDPLANDNMLEMRMKTLEHSLYSIYFVEEGCDGEPLSRVYQDHCSVCGGDNSTCSGCDGIPNTGRDKGCSGHGECKEILGLDEIKCKCVDKYYDIMCSTYCDDAVQCSGNGMCHPDDGRKCICFQGWLHGDGDFPGPFCSEPDPDYSGAAAGGPKAMTAEERALQQQAFNNFLLTVLLPAAIGTFVVFLICYRVLWRRKIQEARLRKEVLYIPQPQLKIKAEERFDDVIAAPDENGWTNIDLPTEEGPRNDTEADAEGDNEIDDTTMRPAYQQGAASGQKSKAQSAMLRHKIGEAAQASMEYRATAMQKHVRAKNTVSRYLVGPDRPVPADIEEELDEDEVRGPREPQSNSSMLRYLPFVSAGKDPEDHLEVAI